MAASPVIPQSEDDLYRRGLKILQEIGGDTGRDVIDSLADIAPDLATHLVAYGFGDVCARPALDYRQRQLITLGILTALGGCEAQLEIHIHASLNAVVIAKKVLAERGLLPAASPGTSRPTTLTD